eukprot:6212037-Pleurochrysis_carterae.AAC.2
MRLLLAYPSRAATGLRGCNEILPYSSEKAELMAADKELADIFRMLETTITIKGRLTTPNQHE